MYGIFFNKWDGVEQKNKKGVRGGMESQRRGMRLSSSAPQTKTGRALSRSLSLCVDQRCLTQRLSLSHSLERARALHALSHKKRPQKEVKKTTHGCRPPKWGGGARTRRGGPEKGGQKTGRARTSNVAHCGVCVGRASAQHTARAHARGIKKTAQEKEVGCLRRPPLAAAAAAASSVRTHEQNFVAGGRRARAEDSV